jgi:preprotein translocase subunit SecG
MLSFLRDSNLGNLPADAAARDAKQNSDTQSKEQEYFTVATHGRAVRKSTTLLAVLFIIGLLCLWFMIKKSAPKAALAADVSTEETQIETAIARLTGIKSEMFSSMDEIVSKFYEFSDVLQVKVSELVKNPFQLEMFLTNLKAESNAEDSLEIDVEMILQEQITRKAMDMKLVSIMQSNQGVCCMINNKILYEGDLIEDFKVKQIGYNHVKLELESVEVTLKLSD